MVLWIGVCVSDAMVQNLGMRVPLVTTQLVSEQLTPSLLPFLPTLSHKISRVHCANLMSDMQLGLMN